MKGVGTARKGGERGSNKSMGTGERKKKIPFLKVTPKRWRRRRRRRRRRKFFFLLPSPSPCHRPTPVFILLA